MQKLLIIWIAILLGFHFAANAFGWYYALTWLDIPMHIIGGMWVAFLFFYLFELRWGVINPQVKPWQALILVLGFAALLGALREFQGYFYDVFIGKEYPFFGEQKGEFFDALKDIFVGLVGGAIGTFLYQKSYRRRTSIDRTTHE